jgi:hypothetical protein
MRDYQLAVVKMFTRAELALVSELRDFTQTVRGGWDTVYGIGSAAWLNHVFPANHVMMLAKNDLGRRLTDAVMAGHEAQPEAFARVGIRLQLLINLSLGLDIQDVRQLAERLTKPAELVIGCRSTGKGACTRITAHSPNVQVRTFDTSRTGNHWSEAASGSDDNIIVIQDISNSGKHDCFAQKLSGGRTSLAISLPAGVCICEMTAEELQSLGLVARG